MPRRGRWRSRIRRPEDEWAADSWDATTPTPEIKIDKPNSMQILNIPADNLGSRHRALNTQVNDAYANQVDFCHAKSRTEVTEIDRLFKIDLASKYKNVNYILEILKSGDSLYIARALKKCQWLFSDDYSDIINPEYLHTNIFPFISMRMKRKILKAAAKNITNPDRAVHFYHCCLKEKMINSALICLIYTSEAFKIDVLQNKNEFVSDLKKKDIIYLRFFVGKSFTILKAFFDFLNQKWKISFIVRQFKHLYYLVSNDQYLDIAEKYIDTMYGFQTDKLDEKLSESIMKNHKDRVLAKPEFYVNTINAMFLVKYSTIDDAKIYAVALLPKEGYRFWSAYHYMLYKSVFKLIPHEKTFKFFKDFFAEHYPDCEEFEMHCGFYRQEYYNFLTAEERHEWALRHLKSQKHVLGMEEDYLWYEFVKFELALTEMKKLINITKEAGLRSNMVEVLIETAKNNRDLESLFNYFYERHLNELRPYKDTFLRKVISHHNVFKFDKTCWAAFYNVLLNMDLYNTALNKYVVDDNDTYKTIIVVYHILYDVPFPEDLMKYFLEDFSVCSVNSFLHKLDGNNNLKLHNFFINTYMKNIVKFKYEPYSSAVSDRAGRYFANIKHSMAIFHEETLPEKTRQINKPKKTRHISNSLSDRKLLRDLKKDKRLVVRQILDVKAEFESSSFRLNNFLKKIKVYFPEDITKVYLGMFEDLIKENKELRPVMAGVHGVFDLGDEKVKLDLIKKYAPAAADTIDPKNIDMGRRRAQKAICRYACISRPPLPLSSMVMYMKGSCAKYFLRVFNTYLATIPIPMCMEFVNLGIDAPVSIQKHAIRSAFQCLSTENLIKIITDIWSKTKNVSMRSVIYKALFNKVIETEKQIFVDVLIKFTLSLHQNDEKELFDLVISKKVCKEFLGGYVEAVWEAVGSFEDIQPNIKRKVNFIRFIQDKLPLLRKNFVLAIVQQHMDMMIKDNKLKMTYANDDISVLCKEKWQLTARFIMHYTRSKSPVDEYVQICQCIVNNSINKWNEIIDGEFVYQRVLWDLFNNMTEASVRHNTTYFQDGVPIFENFLCLVKPSLPFQDAYQLTWELELSIITRKIINKNLNSIQDDVYYKVIIEIMNEFGNELAKLVSIDAENMRFFLSYSSNIKEIIIKHAKILLHIIYYNDVSDYESEYLDDVYLTLASGLVKIELTETYMLAVQLLPTNIQEEDEQCFKLIFDKLQEYSNPEVQFSLHQKFQKYCVGNKT